MGRNAYASDFFGQAWLRHSDSVFHEHLGFVQIRAEIEGNRQLHLAVAGRLGGHVEHVFDAVDFLFERCRDGLGDDFRAGPRIAGEHDDSRRDDLRIFRNRKREARDRAHDDDYDGKNGRKDRPVDKKM